MPLKSVLVPAVVCVLLFAGPGADAQGLNANDAAKARTMLKAAHDDVKKNYYDPTFHGVNWDARYKEYDEKVKAAKSLNDAMILVAEFLEGLRDSHTYLSPPARPYRVDYGYRMAAIADDVFITRVRPDTDAAKKVNAGDRLLSIDGVPMTRAMLDSARYELYMLAPRPMTRLRLRNAAGVEREVVVETKTVRGRRVIDLSGEGAGEGFAELEREAEATERLYRQQIYESGDVVIWKMPSFGLEPALIDKLCGIARQHKTLVLDLRENPGGYVESLKRLVSNLFDRDVKVGERVTRKGRTPVLVKTRGKSNAFTGTLIVLVDGGSGSAAEVLARVVQLEQRGTVIGDRTRGAVMESIFVDETIGLESVLLYGISVTEADLIMADGKSLEKVGVTPNELLLPAAADLAEGRDPVLAKAATHGGTRPRCHRGRPVVSVRVAAVLATHGTIGRA